MDPAISSDDSCDSEIKQMKKQLTEYGFEEDHLSKEEMSDLLKALNNSKTSMKDEENARQTPKITLTLQVEENVTNSPSKKSMKRRYLNVRDRRMPWSLLPGPITQAEKARTLAVYIKLMSMNTYLQARQSINFASWPPPIQILEESTRMQPMRSTRSGRSVPIYADFDDDSSDLDFVVTKTKKRKVSNSDQNTADGVYSNKIVSLKRKTPRDENVRPVKEAKISVGNETLSNNVKVKKDLFSIIED